MVLLSTSFCPPMWYAACIVQNSQVFIEHHENYQKRSTRSRCYIQSSQGPLLISVPLAKGKNQQCPITEVHKTTDELWYKETVRSIKSSYNKAPFYEHYEHFLSQYLLEYTESNKLLHANTVLTKKLFAMIGLEKEVIPTEQYYSRSELPDGSIDYRYIKTRHSLVTHEDLPTYEQVFTVKQGFQSDLSIIDLIMELGPGTISYLESYPFKIATRLS